MRENRTPSMIPMRLTAPCVFVFAIVACRAAEAPLASTPEVLVATIASSSPVVDAAVDASEPAPPSPLPTRVELDASAPRRTPPADPRAPLTWDDLAVPERSALACRADAECVVDIETPPCTCCSYPRVVAIHVREKKKGPPPPQPPCTPACADADRPCRALPHGSARDSFRARCDGATCRLERR